MDLSKATTALDGKASTTTFAQEIAQSELDVKIDSIIMGCNEFFFWTFFCKYQLELAKLSEISSNLFPKRSLSFSKKKYIIFVEKVVLVCKKYCESLRISLVSVAKT